MKVDWSWDILACDCPKWMGYQQELGRGELELATVPNGVGKCRLGRFFKVGMMSEPGVGTFWLSCDCPKWTGH